MLFPAPVFPTIRLVEFLSKPPCISLSKFFIPVGTLCILDLFEEVFLVVLLAFPFFAFTISSFNKKGYKNFMIKQ